MDVNWFRPPAADAGDVGTLNACYNALDIHVIGGRADDVAILDGDRSLTFARVLTEVAAFAGVLQAFGVTPGAEVVVLGLPPLEDIVVQLACARLGAVHFVEPSPAPALVVAGTTTGHTFDSVPLITIDDTGELVWSTMMTAGRAEPAGCAELPGDAPLRVTRGTPVLTADHLLAVVAGQVDDPVLLSLMAGKTLVLAQQQ